MIKKIFVDFAKRWRPWRANRVILGWIGRDGTRKKEQCTERYAAGRSGPLGGRHELSRIDALKERRGEDESTKLEEVGVSGPELGR
jgi:hypothetical protein